MIVSLLEKIFVDINCSDFLSIHYEPGVPFLIHFIIVLLMLSGSIFEGMNQMPSCNQLKQHSDLFPTFYNFARPLYQSVTVPSDTQSS